MDGKILATSIDNHVYKHQLMQFLYTAQSIHEQITCAAKLIYTSAAKIQNHATFNQHNKINPKII